MTIHVIEGGTPKDGEENPTITAALKLLSDLRSGEVQDFVCFTQGPEGDEVLYSGSFDFPNYLLAHECFKLGMMYGPADED